ncbi:MAG: dNTP triphosphohydrolase [Deferribacteraceae bacterium]|jgi:dGTPase|nr:dNTP triphosphohydrolase [Deferribacteraceae bacterium]
MKLNWHTLIQNTCYKDNFPKTEQRNAFVRDVDRVTFSDYFKRLMRKTQVHPLTGNDHVHNRLLHSLEVASVGRSIASMVFHQLREREELPISNVYEFASIVQAACLAHDLGNPPFGHNGEAALKEWFANQSELREAVGERYSDFIRYDGNASSFRIVTGFTNSIDSGIKLTLPSIAAIVKYPWFSGEAAKDKFSFFYSNAADVKAVMGALGCMLDGHCVRHPLSYLSEAADDICYSLLDIEDAVALKIVDKQAALNLYKSYDIDETNNVSHARSRLIGRWIDAVVANFFTAYDDIMSGIAVDLTANLDIERAKDFADLHIYHDTHTANLMIGAYQIYNRILDTFIPPLFNKHLGKASSKDEYVLTHMKRSFLPEGYEAQDLYTQLMYVVDQVTGMTDNFSMETAAVFSGAGDSSWRW